MINKFVFASLLLTAFFCTNVLAEARIYNIEGKYNAWFPDKPVFEGEMGEGRLKHRGYSYTSESSNIVFTAVHQSGYKYFSEKDAPDALEHYVFEQALYLNGDIRNFEKTLIGENISATFEISYLINNIQVIKNTVISYKKGRFYQWSVQYSPALSSVNGKDLFFAYVDGFSVD